MDSCVFYKSFRETAQSFPDEYRLAFYDYLFDCCFADLPLDRIPFPYRPAITQMLASVNSAKDRHDKTIEDGAKGGRPRKYVPPEEWLAYYKENGRKATAEHFGIPEETLKKWINGMGKKGKNLNDNANVNENVNVNVNANDNDNDINSIYINNKEQSDAHALSGIVLPKLKEGESWVTDPYQMADGRIVAEYRLKSGEERTMIISEP